MKKLLSFLLSTLVFLLIQQPSLAAPLPSADDEPTQNNNWYDELFFSDKSFTLEFIRTLGYAYSGGADIGESISTSKQIPDADIDSWYQQWLVTANRLYGVAEKMKQKNDLASAREAYLRASNYYRTAGFYMVAAKDRDKSINTLGLSKSSFLNAIATLPFIQPIKIPYDGTVLPGYLIRSPFKNSPLLIVNTGFDGTAEELYFQIGVAAYERGYNVLLFEGPGQGEVLRKQNIPFRYDWEHVVTPIIDYALTLPDINKNKIALLGVGMGGYLVARAAAFDKRIKACVVNGGVYDVAESAVKNVPADFMKLLTSNPGKFDTAMYDEMKKNVRAGWFFNNAMWAFQAASPADVLTKLQQYSMKDVVKQIKCPMLVVNSEDDVFNQGQAKMLYEELSSSKTFMEFTKEDDAQAHSQMGATAISNEKILNWLNATLS